MDTSNYVQRISFKWEIVNYLNFITSNKHCIQSPSFGSSENLYYAKFNLVLYPNGFESNKNDSYMSIALCSDDQNSDQVRIIKGYVSILDKDNDILQKAKLTSLLRECYFINKQFIGDFLQTGDLTILCVIDCAIKNTELNTCHKHADDVMLTQRTIFEKSSEFHMALTDVSTAEVDGSSELIQVGKYSTKWTLEYSRHAGTVSFKVHLAEPFEMSFECQLSVTNNKGTRMVFYNEKNQYYEVAKQNGRANEYFINACIKKDKTMKILGPNVLYVTAHLTNAAFSITPKATKQNIVYAGMQSVSENLRKLYFSHDFWDVQFNVDGQELRAHKIILSLHSSVFNDFFKNYPPTMSDTTTASDKKEAGIIVVNIMDFDYSTMSNVLQFIYTGTAPDADQMAKQIIVAADKYNLVPLKYICGQILWQNCTVQTSPELLVLAHRCNCSTLKQNIVDFIRANIDELVEENAFQSVCLNYPELSFEIIKALRK